MKDNRYAMVPQALRDAERWVCFTLLRVGDKTKKIPKDPVKGIFAKVDDPDTWTSFDKALSVVDKYDGLGFVLGDGYIGVDLDHVIRDGKVARKAQEIVNVMDTYTEVSPSGTGIHMIAKGSLPEGERRNGEVEMYDNLRYFTVTGQVLSGCEGRGIAERTAQAAQVHARFVRQAPMNIRTVPTAYSQSEMGVTAEQLIRMAGEAANGEKFRRLMQGDLSGYESPSQADLALCNIIAFYAGDNARLIDEVFRQSGLMRSKWDSKRAGRTYGERTIEKALRDTAPSGIPPVKMAPPLPVEDEEEGLHCPIEIRVLERSPRPAKKVETAETSTLAEKAQAAPMPEPARKAENAEKSTLPEGFLSMLDVGQLLAETPEKAMIPTGLPQLDRAIGGGLGSGLYVLGAESSVGKTSLALYLARSAAKSGSRVLFVSYEQQDAQLLAKLVAGLRMSREQIAPPYTPEEMQVLTRVTVPGRDADRSIPGLLQQIERFLKACEGADMRPVVFVDYLQAIAMGQESGARQAIDSLISGLRTLLMRLDGCVFLISSLNRAAYQSAVQMNSFKESGGIEYAADVILGLNLHVLATKEYQAVPPEDRFLRGVMAEQAMHETARQLQLTVLKNRYGQVGWSERLIFATDRDTFFEG